MFLFSMDCFHKCLLNFGDTDFVNEAFGFIHQRHHSIGKPHYKITGLYEVNKTCFTAPLLVSNVAPGGPGAVGESKSGAGANGEGKKGG